MEKAQDIKILSFLSTIIWFNIGYRSSTSPNSGKNLKRSRITSGSFLNYKNVPPFLKEVKLVNPHIPFPTFITLQGSQPSHLVKSLGFTGSFHF